MLQDLTRRADQWQAKGLRLKRVVILSGLLVLAVIASALWNVSQAQEIRWSMSLVLAGAGLCSLLLSLMAYSNTMLVAMYYRACQQFVEDPNELDLVTGTIEEVNRMTMPYIGRLYQVTLSVADQRVRYYCPGKLLQGIHPNARVRLLTHDLFAVRLERAVPLDSHEEQSA